MFVEGKGERENVPSQHNLKQSHKSPVHSDDALIIYYKSIIEYLLRTQTYIPFKHTRMPLYT